MYALGPTAGPFFSLVTGVDVPLLRRVSVHIMSFTFRDWRENKTPVSMCPFGLLGKAVRSMQIYAKLFPVNIL